MRYSASKAQLFEKHWSSISTDDWKFVTVSAVSFPLGVLFIFSQAAHVSCVLGPSMIDTNLNYILWCNKHYKFMKYGGSYQ